MVAIRDIIGDSDSLDCLLGVFDPATSAEFTDSDMSVVSNGPAMSVDSSVELDATSFMTSSWEKEEEEADVEAGGS
jgi:hypothetical protein